MEIKEGMKFRCIKDVVMKSGEITYVKGDIYTSENYGCITNKNGDTNHEWVNGDGSPIDIFSYHFEPIHEETANCDLEINTICDTLGNKVAEVVQQSEPSVKNDFKDGKLRWDLLPLELIEEVVRVYDAGAKKYGANRWQNLDDGYARYKSALLRHLLASEKEDIDEDTGCWHIAQICWNALSMLHFKLNKNG